MTVYTYMYKRCKNLLFTIINAQRMFRNFNFWRVQIEFFYKCEYWFIIIMYSFIVLYV